MLLPSAPFVVVPVADAVDQPQHAARAAKAEERQRYLEGLLAGRVVA